MLNTSMQVVYVKTADLKPAEYNPRGLTEKEEADLQKSLDTFGMVEPIVVNGYPGRENVIVGGHQRYYLEKKAGHETIPAVIVSLEQEQEKELNLRLNKNNGHWEWDMLAGFQEDMLSRVGFSADELSDIFKKLSVEQQQEAHQKLTDKFIIPPFSVFDTRQGYWQDRKRTWLALGIESEIGRGENLTFTTDQIQKYQKGKKYGASTNVSGAPDVPNWGGHYQAMGKMAPGTSIFDPVLCEIINTWFNIAAGTVLDPFAGGSVRGVVAEILGHKYTGIDLSAKQVTANIAQAQKICDASKTTPADIVADMEDPAALTPIVKVGDYYVKREDAFVCNDVRGGKIRTCLELAKGAKGLVTAGSRSSPQVNIVAHVAQKLGIPCRVHTPQGVLSPEVMAAKRAGAEVIQHKAGYNNVIIARAREDAADLSNMAIDEFDKLYGSIIGKAVTHLKDNRFACFVVTEVRNKAGLYTGLVRRTIEHFEAAGAMFYNDIVLYNTAGTLPLRAAKAFNATRKVGKTHQNVLVFYKGDPTQIKDTYGELILEQDLRQFDTELPLA